MQNTKPQILIVSTAVPGKGGVAAVVHTCVQGGLANNFDLRLLATHVSGGGLKKIINYILALLKLVPYLVSRNCRIIHIHTASFTSFSRKSFIVWLAKAFRKKIILHVHGGQFMHFYHDKSSSLKQKYIRNTLAAADKVVVLSEQWKQNISTLVSADKIQVILNPTAEVDWEPSPSDKNVLVFLGDIVDRKGFWDLLDALAIVRDNGHKFVLKYGGKGELETAQQKINELGLANHTRFLGWVSGQQKNDLLQESLVFILPSYDEGLPMGMLEAMAAQIPVITTPVGGIPDVIHDGDNGLLIPVGDVNALADAITRLIESPALREKLSGAALKDVANRFSVNVIVPQTEAMYRSLLDKT